MIATVRFATVDYLLLAIVVILIATSAMFALAETSLVRMTRSRAKALEDEGHHGAKSLRRLAEDPDRFLSPILLLVLFCQLVAATLVGYVSAHLFGPWGVAAATVFEVVIIFVFGEAVPKNWAVRNSARAALLAAPMVTSIIGVPPVRWITTFLVNLSNVITPSRGSDSSSPDVTESELLAMADVAVTDDVIETEERALIHSIIDFGDTVVREVMVPRPDVVAVASHLEVGAVLERAIAAGYSRIPVFAGDLDDIVGIAYTKDLMRAARGDGEHRPVRELAREAHFVPESKRVAPLMREMQAKQFHIAVVVDEYGGTAGLVTLEDLIEELVGEIVDEFDVDEPLIEPIGDHAYRVSGRMPVDEVNELLHANLPAGDWDTVGGLLMHLHGRIPTQGESVVTGDHVLVAERVQGRRIARVKILSTASDNGSGESDATGDGRRPPRRPEPADRTRQGIDASQPGTDRRTGKAGAATPSDEGEAVGQGGSVGPGKSGEQRKSGEPGGIH